MNIKFSKQASVAAAFSLAALIPAPSFAAGSDVSIGDLLKVGDGPGSPGGEFHIDVLSKPGVVNFITFCLEKTEFLAFGPTYKVGNISTGAVNGGLGGGNPDPISNATAWLYSEYRAGNLTGYVGDATSADDLQSAIWHLEDEGVSYGSLSTQAQGWVTAAITNGTGLGNVRVINLLTLSGDVAQDQLTLVPEPETYAMLLAGLGLMGFVARRRQRKLAAA